MFVKGSTVINPSRDTTREGKDALRKGVKKEKGLGTEEGESEKEIGRRASGRGYEYNIQKHVSCV